MSTKHPDFRRRMMALADGGHVRGPGSGTSDSIPARLSDGEFVLPADTVRKVGVKSLRDLVQATHKPSGQPAHPARFADGGLADDERQRPNSFGDAAAAAQDSSVTQVGTGAAAAPSPAATAGNGLRGVADRLGTGTAVSPLPQEQGSPFITAPSARAGLTQGRQPAAPTPAAVASAGGATPGATGGQDEYSRQMGNLGQALLNIPKHIVSAPGYGFNSDMRRPGETPEAFGQRRAGSDLAPGQQSLPAAVTPSTAGAGRGSINPPMADPAKPLLSTAAPPAVESPGYGPIGDRTTLTNAQAATMNPAGRITVTRGANGTMEFSGGNVSGQVSYNDASGKALPGGGLNGKGFSGFDVAPAGARMATGPNGSYAFDSGSSGTQQAATGGQRSPVGMTVEQAQREGLVGERVGYNPDYDTGLPGAGGSAPSAQRSGASTGGLRGVADRLPQGGSAGGGYTSDGIDVRGLNPAQAAQYASEVRGAQAINRAQAEQGKSWESRVAQWNDPFSGVGKARRNMEVSLSSMTPYHHRGKGGPGEATRGAQLAAYGSLQREHFGMAAGDRDDATRRYKSDNTLQAENLQQAGANVRAMFTVAGEARRNQIAGERLAMEQTEAGYKNRAAQRVENAQAALEGAKTPAEQRSARERLLALMGKADDDVWAHSPGGQVLDPKTSQLVTQPGVIYNRRTGQAMEQHTGQGTSPAMPSSRDAMVKGQVYQTARGPARWDGSQFQPVR